MGVGTIIDYPVPKRQKDTLRASGYKFDSLQHCDLPTNKQKDRSNPYSGSQVVKGKERDRKVMTNSPSRTCKILKALL